MTHRAPLTARDNMWREYQIGSASPTPQELSARPHKELPYVPGQDCDPFAHIRDALGRSLIQMNREKALESRTASPDGMWPLPSSRERMLSEAAQTIAEEAEQLMAMISASNSRETSRQGSPNVEVDSSSSNHAMRASSLPLAPASSPERWSASINNESFDRLAQILGNLSGEASPKTNFFALFPRHSSSSMTGDHSPSPLRNISYLQVPENSPVGSEYGFNTSGFSVSNVPEEFFQCDPTSSTQVSPLRAQARHSVNTAHFPSRSASPQNAFWNSHEGSPNPEYAPTTSRHPSPSFSPLPPPRDTSTLRAPEMSPNHFSGNANDTQFNELITELEKCYVLAEKAFMIPPQVEPLSSAMTPIQTLLQQKRDARALAQGTMHANEAVISNPQKPPLRPGLTRSQILKEQKVAEARQRAQKMTQPKNTTVQAKVAVASHAQKPPLPSRSAVERSETNRAFDLRQQSQKAQAQASKVLQQKNMEAKVKTRGPIKHWHSSPNFPDHLKTLVDDYVTDTMESLKKLKGPVSKQTIKKLEDLAVMPDGSYDINELRDPQVLNAAIQAVFRQSLKKPDQKNQEAFRILGKYFDKKNDFSKFLLLTSTPTNDPRKNVPPEIKQEILRKYIDNKAERTKNLSRSSDLWHSESGKMQRALGEIHKLLKNTTNKAPTKKLN